MKNVGGMINDYLISGVNMGGADVTYSTLFADDATDISY
jgi:hypothetical protein